MNTSAAIVAVISCASIFGCAAQTGDDADEAAGSALGSTVHIGATGSATTTLHATTTKDLTVTVDCHPSEDPDTLGPVVAVDAPTLGVTTPARAGYVSFTASVPAGDHTLTLKSTGTPVDCSVRATSVPTSSTCRAWSTAHLVDTDHTHLRVGSNTSQADEPFPASGNHWGAWAAWSSVYAKPVKLGFLLHNLEHGGLVFSYQCPSNASTECKTMETELVSLAESLGESRVIVTPDPSQPTKFGVRAWRWSYASDCLDTTSAHAFATAHFRHGREDEDSNPPIPFDPTGTNVPCQDLMAAPDSCAQ